MFFNKYCEDTNLPSVANRLATVVVNYNMNKSNLTDEIEDFDVEDEIENDRFSEVEEIYYSSDDEDEPLLEDQHESNNFKDMSKESDSEKEYGLLYTSKDVEEGQEYDQFEAEVEEVENEQIIAEENVLFTGSNNSKKVGGNADSEKEFDTHYLSEPEMDAEDKGECGSKSETDSDSDDDVQIIH